MSGDYVWPMPLIKEYQKNFKSDCADFNKMSSSIYGGAITAAVFLKNSLMKNTSGYTSTWRMRQPKGKQMDNMFREHPDSVYGY